MIHDSCHNDGWCNGRCRHFAALQFPFQSTLMFVASVIFEVGACHTPEDENSTNVPLRSLCLF